ncbi:DNA repair protein RecO [Neisseria leonii]|uniref:DNA repair protein RecO n=1 Tax=Neisseria leonii TaxID=2995413 RepID=UPI00237A4CA5|nr:DNA repair protein RecO [Neisseria sp. 3986]MDD9325135.1 DNA repair protein RecO [Neisseria sp. 3986]
MGARSERINQQPAFLLSAAPWRESSLLLEMFSRDYGRVALLARSARRRQSDLRGVLVPFVPVSVSWFGAQEMKTLHRAEWLGGRPQPSGRALFSALYVNELVLRLTAREDAAAPVYHALDTVLQAVCGGGRHTADLRLFEWRLLQLLGYAPDLCRDAAGETVAAGRLYRMAAEQLPQPQEAADTDNGVVVDGTVLLALQQGKWSDGADLQQALRLTRLFIDYYLPQGVHSRRVLQQMREFDAADVFQTA